MSQQFNQILAQFAPETAEQIYGELYQFCSSDKMDEVEALGAFEHLLGWMEVGQDPLAQSYGLLILGGLIDSGKLQRAETNSKIGAFFVERAALVDDYRVLDDQHRFLHFVSHFAYLAGSFCEQFNDVEDDLLDVVSALVDLFLASPDPYWCGEEMLVARVLLEAKLGDATFAKMFVQLKPEQIMQEADNWDNEAVRVWQLATLRENHKRQLMMAMQGQNVVMKAKPTGIFEPMLNEIIAAKFG